MNHIQKELDNILSDLNKDISRWNFNIQMNEKIVEIIIEIYKSAKEWNIAKVKILIEQLKIIFWVSDFPEDFEDSNDNITRDWNFAEDDEEIACSEVESITWIFLNNLKEYHGNNKQK